MKKLKSVSWMHEILVLRLMGFYQGTYCDIWDWWLGTTLSGEFSFSDCKEHTISLTNNSTGVTRTVWTANHPYSSISDYTGGMEGKNRASRAAVNLFVEKYNEYIIRKIQSSTEKYEAELKI